jgi:DNA primase
VTLDALLAHLENVTPRGSRYMARCPAHADKSPSLSVSEGDKGLLVRCFAGCSLTDITGKLGLSLTDLFYDALSDDPRQRQAAAQQRDRQRHRREQEAHQQGALIDAMREADYFVQSRRNLDISSWSDNYLQRELDALADAYGLLEKENLDGQLE